MSSIWAGAVWKAVAIRALLAVLILSLLTLSFSALTSTYDFIPSSVSTFFVSMSGILLLRRSLRRHERPER